MNKKDFYVKDLIRDCVYLLYRDTKLVYVGTSQNVYNRITQHKRDKRFNRVRVLPCRRDRKTYWERVLIDRYEPMYNWRIEWNGKYGRQVYR